MRGPALDSIASRMTEDQIIRQVLQGGGNMPAYGNALNPSETTALVDYLLTLRGGNLSPAIDASRKMVLVQRAIRIAIVAQSTAAWHTLARHVRYRNASCIPGYL